MVYANKNLVFSLFHTVVLTDENRHKPDGGLPFCLLDNGQKVQQYFELQDNNIQQEFEHEFVYPLDSVLSNNPTATKILDALSNVKGIMGVANSSENENLSKSTEVLSSIYKQTPAYKSTSELKMPSNLTFKFYFGQKGLYSGFEEVVYPIISLFCFFLPEKAEGVLKNLPLPTTPQVLAKATIGTPEAIAEAANSSSSSSSSSSVSDDSEESSNDDSTVFTFVSKAITNFHKQVNSLYTNFRGVCRGELYSFDREDKKIDCYKTPIFTFGNVAFSFDFSDLDSDNYPLRGTFTLGGIKTLSIATKSTVR